MLRKPHSKAIPLQAHACNSHVAHSGDVSRVANSVDEVPLTPSSSFNSPKACRVTGVYSAAAVHHVYVHCRCVLCVASGQRTNASEKSAAVMTVTDKSSRWPVGEQHVALTAPAQVDVVNNRVIGNRSGENVHDFAMDKVRVQRLDIRLSCCCRCTGITPNKQASLTTWARGL